MSSTRHTNPDRGVKVKETPHNENKSNSIISDKIPPRKRARSRSIVSGAATVTHASSGLVKEEEMPGLLNIGGARTPLTHTRAEYKRLQRLLEESYLFREQVIEENQRMCDQLHTARRELFKLHGFMDFAARKLHQQATHRFRGIDSDSEDELEDSKSVDEDV
ncbi:hypothetical protein B0H14DRAFT_2584357 [Mycena olivaceomarginata]|nr:hypothetical protein B0H14DRAFT_2584357 [Mycena olivaceomarginata]